MSIETNSYLSKKQKRYKWFLGLRVLFVPARWMRLRRANLSKKEESDILDLLILAKEKPDQIINTNKEKQHESRMVHNQYNITIGSFNFWNANYPYSSGEFDDDLRGSGAVVPRKYIATRKVSLALSDIVKKIKRKELGENNKLKSEDIQKAVSESIMDIHL